MTYFVLANSVDPDQLASSEANWSGSALFVIKYVNSVLAFREVWESETPKNCPGTSKNQCQEVWDSQLLKIFSHL